MIFYFSGTGNTKWAAARLAAATHEDLIPIAPYMRADVFPVHGWRVPRLVREFIRKMKIRRETPDATAEDKETFRKHPFAYCVCTAGDSIGLTIENLNDTIALNASFQALGITEVSASYSLIMPESYVGLPFMDVDPKEREVRKKSKSAQELAVICEEIFDRKEGVKCGICANVCPVGDIKGGHGEYPEWLHHKDCLTCFTCYHHCPHHAIEFGHQTQKKGQYFYK